MCPNMKNLKRFITKLEEMANFHEYTSNEFNLYSIKNFLY